MDQPAFPILRRCGVVLRFFSAILSIFIIAELCRDVHGAIQSEVEGLKAAIARLERTGLPTDDLRRGLARVESARSPGCPKDCLNLWDAIMGKARAGGVYSTVRVQTTRRGAYARLQSVGDRSRDEPGVTSKRPTNEVSESVPIGLYYVWAERDGEATSDKGFRVRLVDKTETVRVTERQ